MKFYSRNIFVKIFFVCQVNHDMMHICIPYQNLGGRNSLEAIKALMFGFFMVQFWFIFHLIFSFQLLGIQYIFCISSSRSNSWNFFFFSKKKEKNLTILCANKNFIWWGLIWRRWNVMLRGDSFPILFSYSYDNRTEPG